MIRQTLLIIFVAGFTPFSAMAARDPDWPCQQIKVPELSLASVWAGPAIDPTDAAWKNDPAVTTLVRTLAPRREPIEHAQSVIHDFAQHSGDHKQTQLLQVLVGLFTVLGEERDSIMNGLDRFGVRQRQLAADIRTDNEKLHNAQNDATADPATVQQLTQKVTWDVEVFQDRRQAISYACDVPSQIEQRLFTLARQIQHELE